MTAAPISAFCARVLRALQSRDGVIGHGGSLRAGRLTAPATVVRELVARDLAGEISPGVVSITEPGRMFLRRLDANGKGGSPHKHNGAGLAVDGFQAQHQRVVPAERLVDGKRRRIEVNLGASPLGWLIRRKGRDGAPFLAMAHLEAGEHLARDFEMAGLFPRTIGFYDGVPITGKKYTSGQGRDYTARQLDARRRVEKALAAVGPGLTDILVRVCCFHEGLEAAERALAWPTRAGKVVLRLALERLALHYGYKKITK